MTIEASDAAKLLTYDKGTGALTWRARPVRGGRYRRHDLSWNTQHAGKPAGDVYASYGGYVMVNIGGTPYRAHRLAWAIVNGSWPKGMLDHANRDRGDNRWANLREATPSQNLANKRVRKDSRSGVKGATWHPASGTWRARISVDGRTIALGLHDTAELAGAAYMSAALRYHGEFACGARN